MLKRLRHKFVLIIMVLVGVVLVLTLGGTFFSASYTQRTIISEALERGLDGDIHDGPTVFTGDPDERDSEPRANMLVLVVDISSSGVVLASNRSAVLIDEDTLDSVVSEALSAEDDSGRDADLHIEWRRKQLGSGAYRVAMADTSASDLALEHQLFQDIAIIVVALAVLFAISWWLSVWALRPVEEAWDKQKQFVADASHELKTPLAVIIANTEILAADGAVPEGSRRWVESTRDEATHMKGLVEELLELARADETKLGDGSGVLHEERVDFSDLVEDAALEFDAVAFERGSSIEDDVAEGIYVTGDREWLARLVKILIDNACKYTQVGSPVRVSLARDGRRCVYSVNNHGNTIPPEELAHVFDRFYRSDKARTRQSADGGASGFGLGLAIAKGIATTHKGTISATSNDVDGTTFSVRLPLA